MISAGETSGDLHGAALVLAAKTLAPNLSFFGLGGERMAAAGVSLAANLTETAVMGLTEVLGSLRRILRVRKTLTDLLVSQKPQALVLIDSPDFNFYLAKKAQSLGIPVIYYICPQIWAWRAGRIKFLAKYCARRAVIFPFEKDYYESRGVAVDWVGHPLLDNPPPPSSQKAKALLGLDPAAPLLALLPGSRAALAKRLTPPFLAAADLLLTEIPNLNLALPRAQSLDPNLLTSLIKAGPPRVLERLKVWSGQSTLVLAAAEGALLASGTSTVEGTILGTPMVVAYKTSRLTFFLAKLLTKVQYVALTNLLSPQKPLVKELLQNAVTPQNLAQGIRPFLVPGPLRAAAVADLLAAAKTLGSSGASAKVTQIILAEINRGANLNGPSQGLTIMGPKTLLQ